MSAEEIIFEEKKRLWLITYELFSKLNQTMAYEIAVKDMKYLYTDRREIEIENKNNRNTTLNLIGCNF